MVTTIPATVSRRHLLAAGGGGVACLILRPTAATPDTLREAVARFTGGAEPQRGRVVLALPPLAESGNSVGVEIHVDSPMSTVDHVRRIGLFNEKNPISTTAIFQLGPRCGAARVATRIRLADTQRVLAIAELSDGSFWSAQADILVTLGACVQVTP